MVVAFIGVDNHQRTAKLAIQIWKTLTALLNEGANNFLFNNDNDLDRDCRVVVSQLKKRHPKIKMHYYHGIFDYDVGYIDWMKEFYDEVHPPKGIPLKRYFRNCAMIDKCDVLVTYCTNDELQSESKSFTAVAIEYALYKKKRVINLCY